MSRVLLFVFVCLLASLAGVFAVTAEVKAQGKLLDVICTFDAEESIGYPAGPAVGDINGDGANEIVFGVRFGYLYALDSQCRKLWTQQSEDGSIFTVPAIGDLNGDGKMEVVFGATDSFAYALQGEDGKRLWRFEAGARIDSSPALVDLNGDGQLEVLFGSGDGLLYALNGHNGSRLWGFETGDLVVSTPAIGDLDNDGNLETVIGSVDSYVYVLDNKGAQVARCEGSQEEIFASPTLGDIDNDGILEIVVGSLDNRVYAFKVQGKSCSKLWAFGTNGDIWSSAALGDLDGDDKLDVVVGVGDGFIYALRGNDGKLLWKYRTGDEVISSPVLAKEIIPDEEVEVVVGSTDGNIYVLKGRDGSELAKRSIGSVRGSPALADINGDGVLEIVVGTGEGELYVLKALGEVPVNTSWPKARGNLSNTGSFTVSGPPCGFELQANQAIPNQDISAGPVVLSDPKAQYCIKVPAEAQLLAIKLDSQNDKGNVDLYIRVGSPVKLSGKTVIADYSLVSDGNEFIVLLKPKAGTYFLAVGNPTSAAQKFTIIATPVADIQGLKAGIPVDGQIDPNAGLIPFLRQYLATQGGMLSLTQYKFDVPSGAKSVTIRLEGPANKTLNLHLRHEKPVEIVADQVAADLSVIGPGGQKGVVLAGTLLKAGRWYIAVESLQAEKVDFKVVVEIQTESQRLMMVLEREPRSSRSR